MALQIGTVDGLINIGPKITDVFIKAIAAFSKQGVEYAKSKGIAFGAAFQRFTYPVYSEQQKDFNINTIETPVYTNGGKEQSPAFVTYCRKMGLLNISESDSVFELTELGQKLYEGKLTLSEYAFVLMSKQGVFKDGEYKSPLLYHFVKILQDNPYLSDTIIQNYFAEVYDDSNIVKTRFDIILGAMACAGLLVKANNFYYIAGIKQARVLFDIYQNTSKFSIALIDNDRNYTSYIGSYKYGIFDILNGNNVEIYRALFPNLNIVGIARTSNDKQPNQVIYFGAPGTGKSHSVQSYTKSLPEGNIYRTTFHPDSDYSTFVGSYKPTKEKRPVRNVAGDIVKQNGQEVYEETITYNYIPQAFTKAYIRAWQTDEPVFLVIEEINRGNCAQIFGDLFQLLDRKDNVSEYPIKPDTDLGKYIRGCFEKEGHLTQMPAKVLSGEELCLPANLYIWATMNTSDQSLFPIDSAFKRRWEWRYMKIAKPIDKETGIPFDWHIEGGIDWWQFLKKINAIISKMTNSADKQLGYFFAKADANGEITYDRFVAKVCFYLWNDIFKTYAMDDVETDLFKFKYTDEEGLEKVGKLNFTEFFDENGKVVPGIVQQFIENVMKWNDNSKQE